jgi:hypothetical protein
MYKYSYKVNQRRYTRQKKRQCIHHLITSHDHASDKNSISGINEQSSRFQHQEQQCYEKDLSTTINNDYISPAPDIDYINEEADWISEDENEKDDRPLYKGSSISITKAVRLITEFYLSINLDKEKVNKLLRLLKSLLPKPNVLPSIWIRMHKFLHRVPCASISFLCNNCYSSCIVPGRSGKICINSTCSTSFRRRRSTEIIEIVRFDIRAQIQSIMSRNISFFNQSYLFPTSDICFGEYYQQHRFNDKSNKISLVVHSDGAPLVRSSKQSIWPCFASIVELPPPAREYQSNIIILALWISKKKPNVNIFLEQTINNLLLLINNGTSIFIEDQEYYIRCHSQFFVSDLPAKALFCCTTNFYGYSACTYCRTRGKLF